jgi:Protein of unknown function (DUF2752)
MSAEASVPIFGDDAREAGRVLRPWARIGLLTLAVWLVLTRLGLVIACPLKTATGLECAFCGATRATEALLSGDIGRAIDLNFFYTVLVLPACALALIGAAGPARWEARIVCAFRCPGRPSLAIEIGVTVLVAWTVARNVPALSWLAAG